MSAIAVRAQAVGKSYHIGAQQVRHDTLRDMLMHRARQPLARLRRGAGRPAAPAKEFWALRDVSFEIRHGEVLGVIGRNGAGKSTLLKILSRVTEPSTGTIDIFGRVGSLLEVGTGFHPELTGRENIYLNGAILGMKRTEIMRRFDEIVDFSEIEDFLDTPVKHYSSGMYVRLAFGVAAFLESEILVVDEVLAVGDIQFQKKCMGKMGDAARSGRTIFLVSHSMSAILGLCSHAMLLGHGSVQQYGSAQSVVSYYLESVLPSVTRDISLADRTDRTGSGRVVLTSFHIENAAGVTLTTLQSGMDAVFVFAYRTRPGDTPRNVDIGVSIQDDQNDILFVLYSSFTGQLFERLPAVGFFRCTIPHLPLSEGRFGVGARVMVAGEESDWPRDGVGYIDIEAGDFYGTGSRGFGGRAPIMVTGRWEVCER